MNLNQYQQPSEDDDFLDDDLDDDLNETAQDDNALDKNLEQMNRIFPTDEDGYHIAKKPNQQQLDQFMQAYTNNNPYIDHQQHAYQLTIPAFRSGTNICIKDVQSIREEKKKQRMRQYQQQYNQQRQRKKQNKEIKRTTRDETKGRMLDLYDEELQKLQYSPDQTHFIYQSQLNIDVNQDTNNEDIIDLIDQTNHAQTILKMLLIKKNNNQQYFKGRKFDYVDPRAKNCKNTNKMMNKDRQAVFQNKYKSKYGSPIVNSIIILCLITQIQTINCLICPNKGVYINTQKSPQTIAQSLCDLQDSQIIAQPNHRRYLAHEPVCVYQSPFSIKNTVIFDYQNNYIMIYQYLDKLTIQLDLYKLLRELRLTNLEFVNSVVLNHLIIIELSNDQDVINNKFQHFKGERTQQSNSINNPIHQIQHKDLQIHLIIIDVNTGILRQSLSRGSIQWIDNSLLCNSQKSEISTRPQGNLILRSQINNQAPRIILPTNLNQQQLQQILDFNGLYLAYANGQIRNQPLRLTATTEDLISLNLKQDNALIGCQGNQGWSCQYRVLIEQNDIGSLLNVNSNNSFAYIMPLAIQIYELIPRPYLCVDSKPEFKYKCLCPGSISQPISEFTRRLQKINFNQSLYITQRQQNFAQGKGCIIPFKQSNQFVEIAFQIREEDISQLYEIKDNDLCINSYALYTTTQLQAIQALPGLNACEKQDSFNSIKGDYNLTIFSIKNKEPQLTSDLIKLYNNKSAIQIDRLKSLDEQFDYCNVKMDPFYNAVFPNVDIEIQEISCFYDEANIKAQKYNTIGQLTNDSQIIIMNPNNNISVINNNSKFMPAIKTPQVQYIHYMQIIADSGPRVVFTTVGQRLCRHAQSYSPNLQRIVQILACQTKLQNLQPLDYFQILDQGQPIQNGQIILTDWQYQLICANIQDQQIAFNNNDTCKQTPFQIHLIRPLQYVQLDAQLSIRQVWAGQSIFEQSAYECKYNTPIKMINFNLVEGQICCFNNNKGTLTIIINNGIRQQKQQTNLDDKGCINFQNNQIAVQPNNVKIFLIKIPDKLGLVVETTTIENPNYNFQIQQEQDGQNFNEENIPVLESSYQPNLKDFVLDNLLLLTTIGYTWIFINSILMNIFYKDAQLSIIKIILGLGILAFIWKYLSNLIPNKKKHSHDHYKLDDEQQLPIKQQQQSSRSFGNDNKELRQRAIALQKELQQVKNQLIDS